MENQYFKWLHKRTGSASPDWLIPGLLVTSGLFLMLNPFLLHPDNVDDPWMLSTYYALLVKGESPFLVFGAANGTPPHFGKSLFPLYSIWFDWWEWSRTGSLVLSRFFVLSGCLLAGWWMVRVTRKWWLGIGFAGFLLTAEPIVFAAGILRPEAANLLLFALALLLRSSKVPALAWIPAWISVEIHLMGFFIVMTLFLYPWLFTDKRPSVAAEIKKAILPAIGGGLYYLFLHWTEVFQFFNNIMEGISTTPGFLFSAYYKFMFPLPGDGGWQFSYHKMVEIIISIGTLWWILMSRNFRTNSNILISLLVIVGVGFLIPKASIHYMVYLFVLIGWVLIRVAMENRLALILMLFLSVLHFPWYARMVQEATPVWEFDLSSRQTRITVLEQIREYPSAIIIGSPIYWYALKDQAFFASTYTGKMPPIQPESTIFIIKDRHFINPPVDYHPEIARQLVETGLPVHFIPLLSP